MTKQQFINRTMQILNESEPNNLELSGSDANSIQQLIANMYPASYRRATRIMRRSWFIPVSFKTATKNANGPDGTGYVVLPSNYAELHSFKMTLWKTSCTEAPEETPEINRKQSNEYLRGTKEHPVCVIRTIEHEGTICKALYYYSLPRTGNANNHIIETALYIPTEMQLTDTLNVTDHGGEVIAWITAATVLTVLGNENAAKAIESKITELI